MRLVNVTTGAVLTIAGGASTGHADGIGASAEFSTPWGIAVSRSNTSMLVVGRTLGGDALIAGSALPHTTPSTTDRD